MLLLQKNTNVKEIYNLLKKEIIWENLKYSLVKRAKIQVKCVVTLVRSLDWLVNMILKDKQTFIKNLKHILYDYVALKINVLSVYLS